MFGGGDVIVAPALRGDDALGFLAAVGLVALAEEGFVSPLKLGWSADARTARFVSDDLGTAEELAGALERAFAAVHDGGRVVPHAPATFPPAKSGTKGSDPMRMAPEESRRWYEQAAAQRMSGNPWFERWLVALASQAPGRRAGGRREVALTPLYAPTGQMTVRASMFQKTMEAVRAVGGPGDALTGWVRFDGYDGANLDGRAKRDAAFTSDGISRPAGAPSPTWLAMMAIRCFPLAESSSRSEAVAWQAVELYPGYTRRSLIWPLWDGELDGPAVRCLLGRPELLLVEDESGGFAPRDGEALAALGVREVYGASRRTGTKGDGPLGPAVRIWSA